MSLVEHALQYAARGWPVFPITRSKVPYKGTHGLLDATTDAAQIEAWWRRWPDANVALATGDFTVIDADGPTGVQRFLDAARANGIPATLVAHTRRGLHFYFRPPVTAEGGREEIRNFTEKRPKGEDGIDIKGRGGLVLLPPSIGSTGFQYRWHDPQASVANMPRWLFDLIRSWRPAPPAMAGADLGLGERPTWLPATNDGLAARALVGIGYEWSAHEEARVRAALNSITNEISYDEFLKIGFGLHSLGWRRDDGTEIGWELYREFCARFPDTFDEQKLQYKWLSYGKHASNKPATIGSVFHIARQFDWDGEVKTAKEVNGIHSLATLMPEQAVFPQSIVFPDTGKKGKPLATCHNTALAIRALGVECSHDAFHDKLYVAGHLIQQWAGDLSDHATQMLRVLIRREYKFDPGLTHAHDASVQLALQDSYDPVCGYLDELVWDEVPRLTQWLTVYMGADDTPLNRTIGRLALVAAVRRVRRPGTKFDQIIVLEGKEGMGKSSAIEILAGTENYSDQRILTLDDRGQQEALQGVWLYEIADLAGMRKAEVEAVKTFASRTHDRARPAYGRLRVDRPRRCIFFASTNDDTYLKSQTGDRRFWPVLTRHINLAELRRDRNQLWAEAARAEASGAAIALPANLWDDARALQDARRDRDPWDDALEHIRGKEFPSAYEGEKEWRISTRDLMDLCLRLPADRQTDVTAKRLAYAMRRLGWDGPRVYRDNDGTVRGYVRRAVTSNKV